jgi:putative hydrolase of the HAD superfamily
MNMASSPATIWTEVHDIDFSPWRPIRPGRRIAALPGRKHHLYQRRCAPYAARVLAARGLTGLFDAVYGVEDAGFHPKPERAAFERVFAQDGLDPTRARCSRMTPATWPSRMRWACAPSMSRPIRDPAPHIHHHAEDLADFLGKIV